MFAASDSDVVKKDERRTRDTRTSNRCKPCNADGKIVRGNSRFELTADCLRYTGCTCQCDGSWTCPGSRATNICCQDCNAKGKVVRGNTTFEMTNECIQYKSCSCRCDGSWSCPGSPHATNICNQPTTDANGCRECDA